MLNWELGVVSYIQVLPKLQNDEKEAGYTTKRKKTGEFKWEVGLAGYIDVSTGLQNDQKEASWVVNVLYIQVCILLSIRCSDSALIAFLCCCYNNTAL